MATNANSTDLPESLLMERLVSVETAAQMCGFDSVPSFRNAVCRGELPKPRKIGLRKVGWRLGDLVDFNRSRPVAA